MTGGTQLPKVYVTLRDPLDFKKQFTYSITPFDNPLARDWIDALKAMLQKGNQIEKNFCFMGFPSNVRNIEYLCKEVNAAITQINKFNTTGVWKECGAGSYIIEEHFTRDAVIFPDTFPVSFGGYTPEEPGLMIKHGILNRLHNHFERLQGTVNNLSPWYVAADHETKYAIRQLNILCHEMESLILSIRKKAVAPEWVRPSQINTFLHADRYLLKDEHRYLFTENSYDRRFATVYMHWAQIGKTLYEVYRDEDSPDLDRTICEAINQLQYYSGEFDIEWGRDITRESTKWGTWYQDDLKQFHAWLNKHNLDPADTKLSLGYLPIGTVDVSESFGTTDYQAVWDTLSTHLDVYKIEVGGVSNTFDYCWSDVDYKEKQIETMKPGYDHTVALNSNTTEN